MCLFIKLHEENFFIGSTTPPALTKNFVVQMLACDLFAVVFLLLSQLYRIKLNHFIVTIITGLC